jgi:hypothetical protein
MGLAVKSHSNSFMALIDRDACTAHIAEPLRSGLEAPPERPLSRLPRLVQYSVLCRAVDRRVDPWSLAGYWTISAGFNIGHCLYQE